MNRYQAQVEKLLEVTMHSGDELMCRCPRHEDNTASLRFNTTKGLFLCFSCQWKGNFRTLTQYMGLNQREVYDPALELESVLAKLDALTKPPVALRMPEAALKRFSMPTDYWRKRGLSAETVRRFDLGWDYLDNAATIPVRNTNGELMGVIRRYLEGFPKYRYPRGFPRKENLFASWLAVKQCHGNRIAITEGALDAIALWQAGIPAVAQYGSSLSDQQVRILHHLGITRLVLFYDNDRAGRDATEQARNLAGRDFLIAVARYPGLRVKDPLDMKPAMLRACIAAAHRLI